VPALSSSPIVAALDQPDTHLDEVLAALGPDRAASSLVEALSAVPDPRSCRGVRHGVLGVPLLGACAVLAGARSFVAIAEYAHDAGAAVLDRLGVGAVAPHESTIRRVLQAVDPHALEAALRSWVTTQLANRPAEPGVPARERRRVLALDGKTVRGAHPADGCPPHLVAVYDQASGTVLAQVDVHACSPNATKDADDTKEADDTEDAGRDGGAGGGGGVEDTATTATTVGSELSVVPALLGGLDLREVLLTADALHTQRSHAHYLHSRGGHYLFTVKANQPTLLRRLRALPWNRIGVAARERARGHGRVETRTISVVSLHPCPDAGGEFFPHAAQAIKLVRRRRPARPGAKWKTVTVYAITSLTATEADPVLLARWIRGHWGIENRLHWVRDVTYDEDRSQVRTGHGPQVMAALRNLAINTLRLRGTVNIAAALRHHARDPHRPLQTYGIT
jgi:predicted transposase YbfD/YdcC